MLTNEQLAYHACSLPEKPMWAVIYGGSSYVIIHIAHTRDRNNQEHVALYVSDTISLYQDPPLRILTVLLAL